MDRPEFYKAESAYAILAKHFPIKYFVKSWFVKSLAFDRSKTIFES